MSDGELLCENGLSICLTYNNRMVARVIGKYMFYPLLSPDGNYLAYTFCPSTDFSGYVKYENWPIPIDSENAEILDRLGKMQKGIYILELSSGKTAFLPLTLSERNEGFCINGWVDQEAIDQFIRANK
jgi:hypothetical protein